MKKITLVFPPTAERFDFVLYPPLGLGYLTAMFQREGWDVIVINGHFLEKEEYEKQIKNIESPIVGISTVITGIEEVKKTARLIKSIDPGKIIIVGGPGINVLEPKKTKDIDVIVQGEAEEFPSFLTESLSRMPLKNFLSNSRNGSPLILRCRLPKDLDNIPYPNREILSIEKYFGVWKEKVGITSTTLISARGCPHNCIFCDKRFSGQRFRGRSAPNIVGEMELLIKKYAPDEIVICDEFFSYDRERVMAICREITKKGLKINWIAQTRVDSIDYEMLKSLKQAGCKELCFGVESGSDKILRYLHKGFNRDQILKAFKMCHEVGIHPGMCLIVGIPGETKQDIEATKELVYQCKPYELGISYLTPFPGTVLFEQTKQWIACEAYDKWHMRNLIYKFPYEVDPKEARESIYEVFFGLVRDGMECSPLQLLLDY